MDHSKVVIQNNSETMELRNKRKETIGWLSMIAIMFLFPTLFYVCVFFPIWVGLTPRW